MNNQDLAIQFSDLAKKVIHFQKVYSGMGKTLENFNRELLEKAEKLQAAGINPITVVGAAQCDVLKGRIGAGPAGFVSNPLPSAPVLANPFPTTPTPPPSYQFFPPNT